MKPKKLIGIIIALVVISFVIRIALMPAFYGNKANEFVGNITGNTYNVEFYSNTGDKTLYASGTNIDLSENIIREYTYSSEGKWGYTNTLSSVITITIDGHEIETCGDTVLFVEDGLKPDVDFTTESISSKADSMADNVIFARPINAFENNFGKSRVVVIKSQLGDPIVAYSGDSVYWEVCQSLPKTTKLYIDGKALYIHRANFQIIDKALMK